MDDEQEVQKWSNDSDVNYVPLSKTDVSSRSRLLNRRLSSVMVKGVCCIEKISGHLECAFTTTIKLRPSMGPAKFICTRDHGPYGSVQCESTIRGEFSCIHAWDAAFNCLFLMFMSTLGQYTTLQTMAFLWLIPGYLEWSCLKTAFLSLVGTTRSANIS